MTTANTTQTGSGAQYIPPDLTLYCDGADVSDYWQPVSMTWGTNGEPSSLSIERIMGTQSGTAMDRAEDFDDGSYIGTAWRLVQELPAGKGQQELFAGRCAMAQTLIQSQPDRESFGLTIYGPEMELAASVVKGAWYATTTVDDKWMAGTAATADCVRASAFQSYMPAVFNPQGRPNASPLPAWTLASGGEAAVFVDPSRIFPRDTGNDVTPRAWTAYIAVRSLVEWLDNGETLRCDWAAVSALLGAVEVRGVDVTGKTIPQALEAILRPLGFGFCVEPWRADGKHTLRVYSLHAPSRMVRPPMAALGSRITDESGRLAQVNRLHFARDAHNIANEITVVGAQYLTERSLTWKASSYDLDPGWDTDEHDVGDYIYEADPGDSPWVDDDALYAFRAAYAQLTDANRHAFRTFVWNEDGRWSGVGATIPDLELYGLTGADATQAIRRPRPVKARISNYDDATGSHAPATVEIQVDGDSTTRIKMPGVRVLSDCAGFAVTEPALWSFRPFGQTRPNGPEDDPWATCRPWSWLEILFDTLRNDGTHKCEIFLTGTIECDRTVLATAPRDPETAWPDAVEKLVEARERFGYRDVDGQTYDAIDADTADDTDAALTHATRQQDALEDAVGHGSIILRGIRRTYAPGDGIDRTSGREVDLTVAAGGSKGKSATAPIIAGVQWQFAEGAYRTELALDTKALQVVS